MATDTEHVYRYERKFFVEGMSLPELLHVIKFNPALFREVYHERWINNIYFDSLDLKNYFDNEAGIMHRVKYRIRWYGELFGMNQKPVLELKIKVGLMGRKESYVLPAFSLDQNFDRDSIRQVVKDAELPDEVRSNLLASVPAIVNRYRRRYFLSADGRFRLTLDASLYASRVGNRFNTFLDKRTNEDNFIIEVKYDPEHDRDVDKISQAFPFRLTKSSKYASSIEQLYDF